MVGRKKSQAFLYIKEKVWSRIQGWQDKLLFVAGKELLIKAIAQAIPTFAMSCFHLSVGLCKDLSAMICNFWWGSSPNAKKIHWLKWSNLCLAKSKGGLGFRDLLSFNRALLSKQGWMLLSNPNSMLAKLFKAKYFPHDSLLSSSLGYNPFYAWRSIHGTIPLLNEGSHWRVGSGTEISIWRDKWIPSGISRVTTPINTLGDDALVFVLIDDHSNNWRTELIDEVFTTFDATAIKSILLASVPCPNRLIWSYNANGRFSVHSAYHLDFQRKIATLPS